MQQDRRSLGWKFRNLVLFLVLCAVWPRASHLVPLSHCNMKKVLTLNLVFTWLLSKYFSNFAVFLALTWLKLPTLTMFLLCPLDREPSLLIQKHGRVPCVTGWVIRWVPLSAFIGVGSGSGSRTQCYTITQCNRTTLARRKGHQPGLEFGLWSPP
jgi:hypothetical protein